MLRFTKMHGLGNDFMVIDAINQSVDLSPDQIRQLAHRQFGIGFDQLLLVEEAQGDADFRYRIFNADGGEVSFPAAAPARPARSRTPAAP